jgi:hypothetical protein
MAASLWKVRGALFSRSLHCSFLYHILGENARGSFFRVRGIFGAPLPLCPPLTTTCPRDLSAVALAWCHKCRHACRRCRPPTHRGTHSAAVGGSAAYGCGVPLAGIARPPRRHRDGPSPPTQGATPRRAIPHLPIPPTPPPPFLIQPPPPKSPP